MTLARGGVATLGAVDNSPFETLGDFWTSLIDGVLFVTDFCASFVGLLRILEKDMGSARAGLGSSVLLFELGSGSFESEVPGRSM